MIDFPLILFIGFADPSCLISRQRTVQDIDFSAVDKDELLDFVIPFEFLVDRTGWFFIAAFATYRMEVTFFSNLQ